MKMKKQHDDEKENKKMKQGYEKEKCKGKKKHK